MSGWMWDIRNIKSKGLAGYSVSGANSWCVSSLDGPGPPLNLLSAPARVTTILAHVGWWFYGWDVLEHTVAQANDSDKRSGNDTQNVILEDDAADEDVDCSRY